MASNVQGDLLPGERLVAEEKVSFQLKCSCPTAPLQSNTEGSVVLTTAKLLLLWPTNGQLRVPYQYISHVQIQQPIFGANYIEVSLTAPAEVEWEGPARVLIYFSSGGCIEFARALVRLSQEWTTSSQLTPTQDRQVSQESLDDKKNK